MLSSNELKFPRPVAKAAEGADAPGGAPLVDGAVILLLRMEEPGFGLVEVEFLSPAVFEGPAEGVCKCGTGPLAVEWVDGGGLVPFCTFWG